MRVFSKDPKFELYSTTFLPSVSNAGRIATMRFDGHSADLVVIDENKPARSILHRDDLILSPQWSADGKQIVVGVGAFTGFLNFNVGNKKPSDPVNGGAQVAMLNADGSGYHLLTSGRNNNAFASFAPDGKSIVYRTLGPDGDGLRIMSLADHSVRKLTGTWDNFAAWSPQGRPHRLCAATGPRLPDLHHQAGRIGRNSSSPMCAAITRIWPGCPTASICCSPAR